MSANNLMHTMPYDMKNVSNTSFRFDSRVYGIPIFLGCQVDSKFEALLLMWAYCHILIKFIEPWISCSQDMAIL